ncbi:hypothetical protein D8Y22_00870 [Salinadaptatus halalkaliphilus]|uniref:Uncharacterized protein n=1 Tax=Salinadaptatus halalkaliphilus TaxID=2419781 RepID=A0A4S3TQP1_9EURY|nr:hypothetical protein D8Y22_00870 [Salinadaptatus halalkaliphilus]
MRPIVWARFEPARAHFLLRANSRAAGTWTEDLEVTRYALTLDERPYSNWFEQPEGVESMPRDGAALIPHCRESDCGWSE